MDLLKPLINLREKGIQIEAHDDLLKINSSPINTGLDSKLSQTEYQWLLSNQDGIVETISKYPEYFERLLVSSNQKSLWFLYQLSPTSSAYNMYFTSVLGGEKQLPLDLTILKESFFETVSHHRSLRTGYAQEGSRVYGNLFTSDVAKLKVDYTSFSKSELDDWIAKQTDEPFDIEKGYVCRANVVFNTFEKETTPYLILTLHHIAGDYYSIEQLMQTWAEYYLYLANGEDQPLPSEQYCSWAQEQQDYLSSEAAAKSLQFWKDSLTPLPEPLLLPTDFERGDVQEFDGEQIHFHTSKSITSKVKTLSSQLNTTPYSVLFSAFQFFFHKLSGQSKFLLGSPTMGRYGRRHKSVVGYCVNPVLIPTNFTEPQSFEALVKTFTEFYRKTVRHQKVPLTTLTESLLTERRADKTAIVSHMFTYARIHDHSLAMPITDHAESSGQRGAAHDLNLVVYEYEDSFRLHWRFNSSLYRKQTVESISHDFLEILETVLNKPEVKLNEHLFRQWLPAVEQSSPQKTTALSLWLSRERSEPALLYNEKSIRGEELGLSASNLAFALRGKGVSHGGRVAVLLPRGVEQVTAMLSAWYVGAAYVPLDLSQPAERSSMMLEEAEVNVVIGFGRRPDWLAEQMEWVDVSKLPSGSIEPESLDAKDFAYLIFTSGSTGKPKAVTVSHGALASYVIAVNKRLEMPSGSVYASLASVATDLGYTSLWGGLLAGHAVRLLEEDFMLDAEALSEHLNRYPVDMLKVVPSHLQGLMASECEGLLPRDALVLGGEGVSQSLLEEIEQTAPSLRIFNHYGPTEATVGVIAGRLSSKEPIALGKPLDGCRVYILDKSLQAVPVGAVGDLYISGNQLAQGYWKDLEKTKLSFIDDPFSDQEKMYSTGDRVKRLPDGRVQFIGRADGQVKIRGYRVELAEVESHINALTGVAEAAVLFEKNNVREALTAIVVLDKEWHRKDDKLALAELKRQLSEKLPAHMQPHFWQFKETIPRAVNGKVDRKALFLAMEKVEENEISSGEQESSANAFWCDLFAQVLEVPGEVVSSTDSFFAIGGDSIRALQLVALARKQGIALTPQLLFKHQSAKELTQVLTSQHQATESTENQISSDSRVSNLASAQNVVKSLWSSTLSVSNVNNDDNFFAIGGDSILALKLIAAAKKEGLTLLPQHVFQHQSVNELAQFILPQLGNNDVDVQTSQAKEKNRCDLDSLPLTITTDEVTAEISARDLNEICQHIPATNIEDVLPLAPTQQGILFHCLLDQNPQLYLNVTSMSLDGHINSAAFLAAWEEAILRHDINRGRFIWNELEQPYLVVCRNVQFSTNFLDWTDVSHQEQLTLFKELVDMEKQTGFALDESPLMKITLIKFDESVYRMVWSRHHLVVDGWTSALIADDAMTIYRNQAVSPAPRYADYFKWIAKQDAEVAEQKWRTYLADVEQVPHLPKPTQPKQGQNSYQKFISKRITQQLESQARSHGLTLNTIVQVAWSLTLSRYLGQYHVLFGMTSSGRPQEVDGIEKMAGVFLSSLPVNVKLDPAAKLIDVAKRMQLDVVELRGIEHVPLSNIQSNVSLEPGELLFDTVLVFQNFPFPPALAEMKAPEFDLLEVFGTSNFPIMLQVTPNESLQLNCTYDCQAVSNTLVERMLSTFELALINLTKNLSQEVHQAVEALVFVPEPLPLAARDSNWDFLTEIEHQSRDSGDAVALITEDRTLTYRELVTEVDALAASLSHWTYDNDQPVAVCLNRKAELLVTLLSLYKLGLCYIPLDPTLPPARLGNIIEQAKPQLTISDVVLPKCRSVNIDDIKQTVNDGQRVKAKHSKQLAYTIFTSGSTGNPKGVQIERGALNHFLQSISPVARLTREDTLLALTTVGFDIAVLELFLPLIHGATVVLASDQKSKDSQCLSDLMERHSITVMQATPATWQSLADMNAAWWASLRVLAGGEALPTTLAKRLKQKAKSVTNVYGPTEATVWASSQTVDHTQGQIVALGKPIENMQFYVLDELLNPVAEGVEGELYISGESLARGYLGRADLTACSFIPNPFSDQFGARMYRTGDRVFVDENKELQFLGRSDFQIKLRGFRIELGEIESVLLSQKGVKEAVVKVWQADSQHGYIAAYVTARDGVVLGSETLLQLAAEHLPAYMIPSTLMIMDALPLNSNGKVDRKALVEPAQQGMSHYCTPTTELEMQLVEIWQELLGHDQIGTQDSFFSLGGNSLTATRLQARIQRTFQAQIALADLFHNPTIAELSQMLEGETIQQDDLEAMSDLLDLFE
ncbi:amino acid adenylation domain-containing protein [Vibrio sp. D420a]|uniref:non-ribosomal peptide synthetase n=1 Tax=Vibrio sp. D420a TaxID=2836895 RepID=UPI002554E6E4|nr:non-ribosomal peptide synthetase [Vibrio sp. D420a]MDK9761973.1 amino acid adenylation domain-containing protein [Vibrio sp. D420a]